MATLRSGMLVVALGGAIAGLLAGDAETVGLMRADGAAHSAWTEVKWPFPLDQWGTGRAFRCAPAECGIEIQVYLRPKIGFCNCSTGVSDDAELDRVGDLELFSDKFVGLSDGRPILVGWMNGRSRPYRVTIPYGQPRSAQAIAFNDKCDVMVATVVADRDEIGRAERFALGFLNSDMVLRWTEKELGV